MAVQWRAMHNPALRVLVQMSELKGNNDLISNSMMKLTRCLVPICKITVYMTFQLDSFKQFLVRTRDSRRLSLDS